MMFHPSRDKHEYSFNLAHQTWRDRRYNFDQFRSMIVHDAAYYIERILLDVNVPAPPRSISSSFNGPWWHAGRS